MNKLYLSKIIYDSFWYIIHTQKKKKKRKETHIQIYEYKNKNMNKSSPYCLKGKIKEII